MKTLSAALLIIGNEILSGKTKDANTPWIAEKLKDRGIRLREVRVVADDVQDIINALNALRQRYTYVFTTGGIGPTHDDITSECVSAAFAMAHEVHPEAKDRLEKYYAAKNTELNAARLRMAMMPKNARLIDNPVSTAPGFNVENVFVMAGVPNIMQGMWAHVETMLERAAPVLSETISSTLKEGDIAHLLGDIQKKFPDVEIGSYPGMSDGSYHLRLVLTSDQPERLAAATSAVRQMVENTESRLRDIA